MSIPYEQQGRTRQKARTRSALVTAARALLAEGVTPTVEQAADRAAISRTTAYRYFANQRALLVATYPEIDQPSLLDDDAPADPLARLAIVTDRLTRQVVDHEPELRAQLRLSLDPSHAAETLPFRQGRAIAWIEEALRPLGLPRTALRKLVLAIRATTGIEALVWLTDIAGLSREEARTLMCESALTLAKAALR
jgi:AcrR family transcriptional regulator